MNETIGVKGGKQDRRRQMRIKKRRKKIQQEREALDQETLDLEKQVRKLQILTFLGAVPIAAVGATVQTLTEDPEEKRRLELEEAKKHLLDSEAFSEEDTKQIIKSLEINYLIGRLPEKTRKKLGLEYKHISDDFDNPNYDNVNVFEQFLEENKKDTYPVTESERKIGLVGEKSPSIDEQLERLKSHKIISEYENELKEVRSELRKLTFEIGVLSDYSEDVKDSKEAEQLIDRLNSIISKVEELKKKMTPEQLSMYDDNYLYVLVENYLNDFKNGKSSPDIKDSMLFILLSEKLQELDNKKDKLSLSLEDKKDKLHLNEQQLESIKEEYYNYAKFNTELLRFQSEQDFLLRDLKEKMANATRIEERVEFQFRAMNQHGNRLLQLMGLQMFLPGARSARGIATASALYMNFMRNIMNPQTIQHRYKVIRVEDYSRQIENSLADLENISDFLGRTSRQLRQTIRNFEETYKDYLESIPEAKSLLSNLYRVQSQLSEKEYELEQMKKEQQKNLQRNNQKVKALDNKTASLQQNDDGENIGMLCAKNKLEKATFKAIENKEATVMRDYQGGSIAIYSAMNNLEECAIKVLDLYPECVYHKIKSIMADWPIEYFAIKNNEFNLLNKIADTYKYLKESKIEVENQNENTNFDDKLDYLSDESVDQELI